LGLAVFHTVFNASNVLLLLPFVPWLVRIAEKSVKSEDDDAEEFKLKYISSGFLNAPSLALENAKKEIEMFSTLVYKMDSNINSLFFEKQKNPEKLLKKIKNREEITDSIDLEISDYLTKVSESDLTKANTTEIRGMLSTSNDLERIADIIYEMSKNYERLKRENVELPPNAKEELKELMEYTSEAIGLVKNHIEGKKDKFNLEQIINTERKINKLRKKIFTQHFVRLESGVYSARAGVIFIDFVNRAERIGDHCMNVHEALYNKNDLFEAYDNDKKEEVKKQ
ncbi:MAG: Na/Pi cotransporter family protein, partial [Bacteroidetes bacterium]|nr:Na/Pi cotransporter family protein [Bacteroidota bacterium]